MAKKAHSNTKEAFSAIENHQRQSEASSKALENRFLVLCSNRQEGQSRNQQPPVAVSIDVSRDDSRETR